MLTYDLPLASLKVILLGSRLDFQKKYTVFESCSGVDTRSSAAGFVSLS